VTAWEISSYGTAVFVVDPNCLLVAIEIDGPEAAGWDVVRMTRWSLYWRFYQFIMTSLIQ
jgi:hypothetical protein